MEILVALVISIPPTIAALAAWRASNKAVAQTNGHLEGPLTRIEAKIEDMLTWQIHHDRLHANLRENPPWQPRSPQASSNPP